MAEPETPVINEAYVLGEMSADLRGQYDVWLAADAGRAGRLAEIASGVVLDFRTALLAIPDVTLLPGCLTEPCYPYALTMIWYHLSREMGLVVSPYLARAYCNAETFLRNLEATGGEGAMPIGEGWDDETVTVEPSPSYVAGRERVARELEW